MRIYTKTGDKGMTQLLSGKRVSKSHIRIKSYGEVDELNSFLGLGRSTATVANEDIASHIKWIQNELFNVGSRLACDSSEILETLPQITSAHSKALEDWIDEATDELPELKNFIIPGGHIMASHLHVCRSICRRVERTLLELKNEDEVEDEILIFFNRLSDLLFCWARLVNHQNQIPETLWSK